MPSEVEHEPFHGNGKPIKEPACESKADGVIAAAFTERVVQSTCNPENVRKLS